MPNHAYAIFFREPILPELLSLLGGYIHTSNNLSYIACNSVEHLGAFVLATVIKNKKDTYPWPVQIPVGCVLAIADLSKPNSGPGFLWDTQ